MYGPDGKIQLFINLFIANEMTKNLRIKFIFITKYSSHPHCCTVIMHDQAVYYINTLLYCYNA